MTTQALYEGHAAGLAADLCQGIRNGLREHIDRVAELCKTVHGLHPRSVLDAPCGTGMLTSLISLYLDGPERVVGIDLAEGHVQMARTLWNVNAVQADLLTYQPEQPFELVLCCEMLEHVHDPAPYVRKALSLSSKYVLFTVPLEAEPVDGEFHVAKVHPTSIWDWVVAEGAKVERMWVLPSAFGEKPKWLGWIFCLARVAP